MTFSAALVIIALLHTGNGEALVAWFNKNDIKGSVEFNDLINNRTKITTQFDISFKGTQNMTKIKIYKQLPNTHRQACKISGELMLQVDINDNEVKEIPGTYVKDQRSLLAHTLMLFDKQNNTIGCATVTSKGENNQYGVAFISNPKIAGKVEFIKNEFNDVAIFGQFHFVMGNISSLSYHIASGMVTSKDGSCSSELENILDPAGQTNRKKCTNGANCPIGDLSGIFGNLTVGESKIFAVYPNLRFSDILSKAFAIKSNGTIVGCGNIELGGTMQVQSTFKSSLHKGISGYVRFTQVSPYHETMIDVSLRGLEKRVKGYHVHQFPISDLANPCSPSSVGGHLNPDKVNAMKSPDPWEGTMENYEYGDLSGKYGFLTNKAMYSLSVIDLNLPLYGPASSVGRSVVIHKNDAKGSRFVCANIEPVNGRLMSATSNFTKNSQSILNGYVKMSQWILPNGVKTQTMMQVELSYKDGKTFSVMTAQHSWHVHELKVDHAAESSVCMSVAGHYNPYQIDVKNPKYKKYCSPQHQYSCEVGDTSSKTAVYDINGEKKFYVDEMAPMFGDLTGIGRSITFHAKNKGAPRLACASLIPDVGSDIIRLEATLKDRSYMREQENLTDMLTDYLGIPRRSWQINSLALEPSPQNDDCFKVSFYMLGDASYNTIYKIRMKELNEGKKKLGGVVDSCRQKTSNSGYFFHPSKLLMAVSLVILWFC